MSGRGPRPATAHHEAALYHCLLCLREALEHAKRADSPKLAAKIRLAINSQGGAARHVSTRRRHTEDALRITERANDFG